MLFRSGVFVYLDNPPLGSPLEDPSKTKNSDDFKSSSKPSLTDFISIFKKAKHTKGSYIWRPAYNLWTKSSDDSGKAHYTQGTASITTRNDSETSPTFGNAEKAVVTRFLSAFQ